MVLFWPLDKIFITQEFGVNADVYKQFGLKGHNGIDLRTRFIDSPLGHRYVTAAADGKVERIEDQGKKGYGLHIRIRHNDGSMTLYGHLAKVYVQKDQIVGRMQQIGLSDNSGFSSGPHLHFEYRPGNADVNNGYAGAIDPTPLLLKGDELKNAQSNPPDTELEEVKKWCIDNELCHLEGFDQPLNKQDAARMLYRFCKKFIK